MDVDDNALLGLAAQLLDVYRATPPPARADIAAAVEPLLNTYRDTQLAKGLNKLLLDRSEFGHTSDLDFPALRAQLFEASFAALRDVPDEDAAVFRKQVLDSLALPGAFTGTGLYADLPENEQLVKFKDMTPRELLQRYNVALVQSLLLRADSLRLAVSSADAAQLRRLFKYLRFFRLLARVNRADAPVKSAPDRTAFEIVIDGPASLVDGAKKYGLQLASFFPAVCGLERWQLDTSVPWKGRKLRLLVSERARLVSHYRNLGAYTPEEIRMFAQHFAEKVQDWQVVDDHPFLETAGQELVFPDLSFRDGAGQVVHLELFHRWHAGQLLARLEFVEAQPDLPLIVGVDQALAKRPEIRTALDANTWFEDHGFEFRNYPTVAKVKACLARIAPPSGSGAPDTPVTDEPDLFSWRGS